MNVSPKEVMVYGNTLVELDTRCMYVNHLWILLAPMEFNIFQGLLQGRPAQKDKNVAVHLCRIRKKLRTINSNIAIKAVRDRGYHLFVEGI